MRWIRRVLTTIVILLIVALVATTAGLAVIVQRGFPQRSGTAALPGLSADVQVVYDASGIPQVYASTPSDLFAAEGWLHASERMWQMEIWRRLGSGRLAELFGQSEVKSDEFVRTLGWRQSAERDLAAMDPATRQALDAYASGVNAWLNTHRDGSLPFVHHRAPGCGRRPGRVPPGAVDGRRLADVGEGAGLEPGRQHRHRDLQRPAGRAGRPAGGYRTHPALPIGLAGDGADRGAGIGRSRGSQVGRGGRVGDRSIGDDRSHRNRRIDRPHLHHAHLRPGRRSRGAVGAGRHAGRRLDRRPDLPAGRLRRSEPIRPSTASGPTTGSCAARTPPAAIDPAGQRPAPGRTRCRRSGT